MGVLSHQRSALRLKGNIQGTTLFMLAQDKLEYSVCDDCKIETPAPCSSGQTENVVSAVWGSGLITIR